MMPKDTNIQGSRFDRAIADFKNHGGILRTAQALRSGIHPGTLYAMRDSGVLEMVSRSVYRIADCFKFRNLVSLILPNHPCLKDGITYP